MNNILNTPDALEVYTHKSSVGVFERTGVLTAHEIEARNEIKYEDYILRLQIEGRVINDLVNGHIIPSAISYQSKIAENIKTMHKIGQPKHSLQAQIEIVTEISEHVNAIYNLSNEMAETRGKANVIEDAHKRAKAYCNMVKPMFDQIRKHCDRLEDMVDDQAWTLPKYRELLYSK